MKSLLLFLAFLNYANATKESFSDYYDRQFKAHAVNAEETGAKVSLQWQQDRKARKYKSALLKAWDLAKEPNFAGHYFAVQNIGCGAGCSVIFVVDWNTGKIFSPPEDHAFAVRKNSRLMILKPYAECTAYGSPMLFEFSNDSFHAFASEKQCDRS